MAAPRRDNLIYAQVDVTKDEGARLYEAYKAGNMNLVRSIATEILAVRARRHQQDVLDDKHNNIFGPWLKGLLKTHPDLELETCIKPMVVIFSRAGDTRKLFYNDGLLTWEQAALWKLRAARDCTPAASYTCPDVASTPRRAIDWPCRGFPLIHQRRWHCARAKQSVDRDRHGLLPHIGLRRGDAAVGPALPHRRGEAEAEEDVGAGAAPA